MYIIILVKMIGFNLRLKKKTENKQANLQTEINRQPAVELSIYVFNSCTQRKE